MALLKPNKIEVLIKNGAFLIRECVFNNRVSEALLMKGVREGQLRKRMRCFCKGLRIR
jgi:hypothetical protein